MRRTGAEEGRCAAKAYRKVHASICAIKAQVSCFVFLYNIACGAGLVSMRRMRFRGMALGNKYVSKGACINLRP